MHRRAFLCGAAAAAASTVAHAKQDNFGGLQRAYVEHPQIIRQQCPQWCWAASASMIFAHLGHPVDQMKIVQRLFGGLVCAPSGNTINIARVLSAPWIDDNGQPFQCQIVGAYDPMNGIAAINNQFIINELVNDRPLLYCNTHHAMVVVDFNYAVAPNGMIVPQQVGVLDPWPMSPAFHPLTLPEMTGATVMPGGEMTFLAAVHV